MPTATRTDAKSAAYETFKLRLSERMTEKNTSARALSRELGQNESYIGQVLSGKNGIPGSARLLRIAEILETTTDWLVGKTDNPGLLRSEVGFRELPQGWRDSQGQGIPLVGTGYCADLIIEGEHGEQVQIERIQLDVDHTLRMIERPSALWNAPNAYAIYFQGSSMERRFYSGEIGIVDPNRPPSPGHIVLVKLSDGESQAVMTALVKELVRSTSAYVELLQYNPEVTFRVPRGSVIAIDRVYRPDELIQL